VGTRGAAVVQNVGQPRRASSRVSLVVGVHRTGRAGGL